MTEHPEAGFNHPFKTLLWLWVLAYPAHIPAQGPVLPEVAAVVGAADNSDGVNPGIARGGLFTIYGVNFALSKARAASFPLSPVLNGVRVQVCCAASQTPFDALPVSVSPDQINAVMPSAVSEMAMQRVEVYSQTAASSPASGVAVARIGGVGEGVGGGVGTGVVGGIVSGSASAAPSAGLAVDVASAGVPLYAKAQQLEQFSRTDGTRLGNADKIKAITKDLGNREFIAGFGSIGGEEFFSYLNISDSLHRTGGPEWHKWNAEMKTKLVKLQNEDGTWAGQHCITGRVAVTSAAILLLLADHDPVAVAANARKH